MLFTCHQKIPSPSPPPPVLLSLTPLSKMPAFVYQSSYGGSRWPDYINGILHRLPLPRDGELYTMPLALFYEFRFTYHFPTKSSGLRFSLYCCTTYFYSHCDKMTKQPLKGSEDWFWLMVLMYIHRSGAEGMAGFTVVCTCLCLENKESDRTEWMVPGTL